LAHEPRAALDGGPDGLALVSALIESAPEYLHPGGLLALEIGANQAEPVRSLLEAVGRYGPAALHHDLAGRERVILARVRS
ncbi:MAG: protein-(glutamine-N5) methyltransferase, release factor-specific, partial [Firmicutes bacterium]|nr:protein-(glutamine-N5) methyltransferase, release factor-specific [Bacillota bacterium]